VRFFSDPLLTWTKRGLYCEAGDFYIDPSRAVEKAIITHAHSDHARRGSKEYLCEKSGVGLLRTRLGNGINVRTVEYGEKFKMGGVIVSLHSAGHILGSAQVRVERGSEVWVASGDYKRDPDPSCAPFEIVKCDTFITEATFGTPKFTWDKRLPHGQMIFEWWEGNAKAGKNSVLFGYSLGKAQRILAELHPFAKRPVVIHSTVADLTECYRQEGIKLTPTITLEKADSLQGDLLIIPPSALRETWVSRLGQYETAFASGWMQNSSHGFGFRGGYDRGFVISDHADWNDLNQTIRESEAKQVFVQHRKGALVSHLRRKGIDAYPIEELTPDAIAEADGNNLRLFRELK
jgi:putative mRNA 3-end processing factor